MPHKPYTMPEDFDPDYFDTEDADTDHEIPQGPPREDLEFGKPPQPEPPEPAPPDMATIAELLTEALHPLESAIGDLAQAHTKGLQAREQTTNFLLKTLSDMKDSLTQSITESRSETNPGDHNISALQFQAAMLQPCNGQILPEYVRDEIDRLYDVEKAYKITKRAVHALEYILNQDRILLKLPEDPDEQLLFMAVLNGWYTQAHPDRQPLKLSRSAPSPPASSGDVIIIVNRSDHPDSIFSPSTAFTLTEYVPGSTQLCLALTEKPESV